MVVRFGELSRGTIATIPLQELVPATLSRRLGWLFRLGAAGRIAAGVLPSFRFVLSALVSQAGVGAAGNLVRV